jgi:hypothetical protein
MQLSNFPNSILGKDSNQIRLLYSNAADDEVACEGEERELRPEVEHHA